jgi:hypothetical protein
VLLAARMRMAIGEHQPPAVRGPGGGQLIGLAAAAEMKGKVIETRTAPLMSAVARPRSGTQSST